MRRLQAFDFENVLAQCMAEEGWEYRPQVDPPDQETRDFAALTPEEYGEAFGYGIIDTYREELDRSRRPSVVVNPNEAYLATLSPNETISYFDAFYGSKARSASEEAVPLSEQGCTGKAQLEVYSSPSFDPAILEDVQRYSKETYERDDVAANERAWAACMGSGARFMQDAERRIEDMLARARGLEVLELSEVISDPQKLESAVGGSSPDPSGNGSVYFGEAKPVDSDKLDEMMAKELDTYRADLKCREETGIARIMADIQDEIVREINSRNDVG
jgi:hypothetical protein